MGCAAQAQVKTENSIKTVNSQAAVTQNHNKLLKTDTHKQEFISVANLPDQNQPTNTAKISPKKYFTIPNTLLIESSTISTVSGHTNWATLIYHSPLKENLTIELQVLGENPGLIVLGGVNLTEKQNLQNIKLDTASNLPVWTYEGTGYIHSSFGTFSYNPDQ